MGLSSHLALSAKSHRHGREHSGNARGGKQEGLDQRLRVSPPCSAMELRSEMTGSPLSKSVVATSSIRPLAASVAMAAIMVSSA